MGKLLHFGPILLIALGVLLLLGGSTAANAEEGAAGAIGSLLQSKWLAIGILVAGALLFAHDEGYLKA